MLPKEMVMLDDLLIYHAQIQWGDDTLSSEDVYYHKSLLDSIAHRSCVTPKRGHAVILLLLLLLLLTNLGAGPAQCGRPWALLWGDSIALWQGGPDLYWQGLACFPLGFLPGEQYQCTAAAENCSTQFVANFSIIFAWAIIEFPLCRKTSKIFIPATSNLLKVMETWDKKAISNPWHAGTTIGDAILQRNRPRELLPPFDQHNKKDKARNQGENLFLLLCKGQVQQSNPFLFLPWQWKLLVQGFNFVKVWGSRRTEKGDPSQLKHDWGTSRFQTR